MTTSTRTRPYRLDVHPLASGGPGIADDVSRGLTASPKWLLPKYFYDERGSALFEEITDLPEYYQTRTEFEILRREAAGIVERHGLSELVELGSGSSKKTEAILDAMEASGRLDRYVPFDVSPGMLLAAAGRLAESYPGLRVHAVAGDFERHLRGVPARGRSATRLVAILGGTIGNFPPDTRTAFLSAIKGLLRAGDRLLMGVDLVGDVRRLEAAYNDSAGVTAAFNLNVLAVLNRELRGNFDLDAFEHGAFYDPANDWIEMRLRSLADQAVRLDALDLDVAFADGEEMRTEISCKFTRSSLERAYAGAGLQLLEWHTDPGERFAVSIAGLRPSLTLARR